MTTTPPSFLALDLSLVRTGWATYIGWTTTGTVEEPGSGMERLERIRSRISILAAGCDLVILEGYSFASRGRAIVSLGELGGVVRHWLHCQRIPVVEIPPSCRAKYATGKGNASKDAVLAEAIRRLEYDGHLHDEADALWLLTMALDHYGLDNPSVPKAHRSALEKIHWPELRERAHTSQPSAPEGDRDPEMGSDKGPGLFEENRAVSAPPTRMESAPCLR